MANDVILRLKTVMESSDVISNLNQIQSKLESLKMPKDLTDKTKAKIEELTRLTKEYQNILDKPHKSNADLKQLDQLSVKIKKVESETEKMIRNFDFSKVNLSEIDTSEIDRLQNELKEVRENIQQFAKTKFETSNLFDTSKVAKDFAEINKLIKESKSNKTKGLFSNLTEGINTGDLDKVKASLEGLTKYLRKGAFKDAEGINNLWRGLEGKSNISGVIRGIVSELERADSEFSQTTDAAKELENSITEEITRRLTEMAKNANLVGDGFRDASDAADTFRTSAADAAHQQSEMQMQVENLQQQIKNYFGLDEVFRKIGDIARDAMNTVKELDAAMTETAVVTSFSVGDMWEKLPMYTEQANKLGSTIRDVYEASTLYYQQGLNTSQAMGLSEETLKMARIAGMDAAEATDMMTSALRGFNMEINQASAQKINDVYSKLAAVTAADTQEIGTAMEKTASLASSAGMDFETTTAFLSQMIETTREAPENLGTAMKTIIARFQELKKDPTTLVDAEGQILDYNKIDSALKTIGVTLVDTNGNFRKLDEVFLEISSKWDGLSQAQQRYIATTTAGSRQQSRFIAMMQDYDRTMELVNAAYASGGAGQEQYEKTLESMDAKLNKLKNAWDQFAMGLMNSEFLKLGVDVGTKFLGVVESVINLVSKIGIIDPFQNIVKSALTATTVFGGLLAMSKLLMAGVGKFAGLVLGEEAQDMRGIVGASARRYATPGADSDISATQRRKEQAQRRARAKEIGQRGSEARYNAYIGAARNGGLDEDYVTEVGGIRGFNRRRDDSKSRSRAGHAASQEIKKLQKQLLKGASFREFTPSFGTAGKEAQKAFFEAFDLKEVLEKRAREAINASTLENDVKQGLHEKIDKAIANYENDHDEAGFLNSLTMSLNEEGLDPVVEERFSNVADGAEKVGAAISNAGDSLQMFGANLMGTPLEPFGNALMFVGQGLESVGMLVSGLIGNVTTFGSKMVELGASTLATGVQASTARKFFLGLKTSIMETLVPMLPFIAIAALVAAALVGIYMAATANERALKKQASAAASAAQAMDTAKQGLEAVKNDLAELSEMESALDGLTAGTTAWNEKIAESNQLILEMMNNYAALSELDANGELKYIKNDSNGMLSITQEGLDRILEEQEAAVKIATANSIIQTSLYENLKSRDNTAYGKALENAQHAYVVSETDKAIISAGQQAEESRLKAGANAGIRTQIADLGLINEDAVNTILTNNLQKSIDRNTDLGGVFGTAFKWGSGRKELEEEYAELLNLTRVGKGKFKDNQNNDITVEWSDIKEQIPELRALNQTSDQAKVLSSALTGMDREFGSYIAEGYNKDKEKEERISPKILSDILSENADLNADEVRKLTKLDENGESELTRFIESYKEEGNTTDLVDETKARRMEALTGEEAGSITTVGEFNKALEKYQASLEEHANATIEAQNENVYAATGFLRETIDYHERKNERGGHRNLSNFIGGDYAFDYEQLSKIASIADSIADNLGGEVAYIYGESQMYLQKRSKGKNNEEAKRAQEEINEVFSNTDFTSSLSYVSSINKLAKSTNKYVREDAEKYKESYTYAEQTAAAFQQVITSNDYEQAVKDITGGFNATNIREAAASSLSLKTYLDETNMSAAAFADIANKINNSELNFDDLTPGLISFANAMNRVEEATNDALLAIENFDAGNDYGSVNEFTSGAYENINRMMGIDTSDDKDKKDKEDKEELVPEWGNEQLGNYFDYFFGVGTWDKTNAKTKNYEKSAEKLKKRLDKILTPEGKIDTSYVESKLGLDKKDKIEKTTDELIEDIKNELEISKEAAEGVLTSLINENPTLGIQLKANDAEAGVKEFQKTNEKQGKALGIENGVASTTDMINIAQFLEGEDLDKYWADMVDIYGGNLEDLKKASEAFAESDGGPKAIEEYTDAVNEAFTSTGKKAKEAKENTAVITTNAESSVEEILTERDRIYEGKTFDGEGKKKGPVDLEEMNDTFLALAGGNANLAEEAIQQYIVDNGLENQNFEFQGQTITGQELLDEGVIDSMSAITETSQWAEIGKTMAESFANTLTMVTDENGITSFVTKGEAQAQEFTTDERGKPTVDREGELFNWLKEEGATEVKKVEEASAEDNTQKENRQIIDDFIASLESKVNLGEDVSESDREGLWKKLINETEGEGLAYGKNGHDKERLQTYAGEYSELLSKNLFDSKGMMQDFGDLMSRMKDDNLNSETQQNIFDKYFGQFQQQFNNLDPEKQLQAIDNLVQQMNEEEHTPEEIAAAIKSLTGKSEEEGGYTVEGEEGAVKISLAEDSPLKQQLEDLEVDVRAKLTNITASATGQNNPNSMFHRTGTMARGSRGGYTIPGRPTLTGEEGEELVWEPKRNEAFMVGSNGPQFANISKDAVVWNADQTKRIKRNSGSVGRVGTGARGITPLGTMAQAKGTDGAGGGKGSGGGTKIPGIFTIDAVANITEVVPPEQIDPIPIKGKISIEPEQQGGLLSKVKKMMGGGKDAKAFGITVKPTEVLQPDKEKTINVKGKLTEVKNDEVKTIKGIDAVARVKKVIKTGKVAGEPVIVNAKAKVNSADTGGAEEQIGALNDAANSSGSMTVDADTHLAMAKVNRLINRIEGKVRILKYKASGPDKVDVDIYPNFKGKWERTLRIIKGRAKGMNYQKYNSYAGGHGLIGPKGRGGLTLTGEEGYEVVWLPSQNKSMIVGAEGPQMVNLPPNAVVWPHEQSKKIMNNNRGTPVGSMKKGSVVPGVTKTEKGEVKFFKLLNLFDKLQTAIEKNIKTFEKASDAMDRYANSVADAGKIDNEITKQLKSIKKIQQKASREQNTALKLTKKINKSQKGIKISYDNGKSGKKNKSKETNITEGKLVNRNKNGELVINEKYIRKRARKVGKNPYEVNQLLESMRSEAKSLIDTYNGNITDAKESLEDAKEKQRDLIDKIKEVYYEWENELTKLKNIQTQIDLADSYSGVISSIKTMLESQLKAGFTEGQKSIQRYSELVKKEIDDISLSIKNNRGLLTASIENLSDDVRAREDWYNYETAKNKLDSMSKDDKDYADQSGLVETLKEKYAAKSKGQDYIKYTRNTDGTVSVEINWAKLEKDRWSTGSDRITDTQYEAIKEYFDTILDDVKELNNVASNIYNDIGSLYELRVTYYSQIDDAAKTIAAGMRSGEETTIKEFETLNTSIKSELNKILTTVKKGLDRRRKEEQNAETEKDISKRMNRLAALRADTSGSNQVEIAKLEEEIRKANNDYQKSLEDQLLEKLQDSMDEASEQREKQITLLQAQLEYSQSAGEYILKAQDLIEKMIDGTATSEDIKEAEEFFKLGSDGNEVLTKWGEVVAQGKWDNTFVQIKSFSGTIEDLNEKLKKLGETISFVNAETGFISSSDKEVYGEILKKSGTVGLAKELKKNDVGAQGALNVFESLGVSRKDTMKALKGGNYSVRDVADSYYGKTAITADDIYSGGYTYKEASQVYSDKTLSKTGYKSSIPAEKKATKSNEEKLMARINAAAKNGKLGAQELLNVAAYANSLGYNASKYMKKLAGTKGLTWKDVIQAAKDSKKYNKYRMVITFQGNGSFIAGYEQVFGKGSYAHDFAIAKANKYKAYATGGLNTQTGPAWLDGTPTKPELVLNATDTKNFLALRDVLSNVMGSIGSTDNSYRSNDVYNINVNVDKIANDYDVDKMVDRVKKEITKSAGYRNVTQARAFR